MKCVVFRCRRKADTYLYVPENHDLDNLPQALLEMLGELSLVLELELSEERKLAQVDVMDVMKQLSESGYFLQMPPGDGRPHPLDA